MQLFTKSYEGVTKAVASCRLISDKRRCQHGCQTPDYGIQRVLSNPIPVIVKFILFGHDHCLTNVARKIVVVPVPSLVFVHEPLRDYQSFRLDT